MQGWIAMLNFSGQQLDRLKMEEIIKKVKQGRFKLMVCGSHEAAQTIESSFSFFFPAERIHFQYTTNYGVKTF